MKIILYIGLLILTSCMATRLTNKAYYDIDEASIRLTNKLHRDTIAKDTYEITHDLPGSTCNLLTVTSNFDSPLKTGISIRFRANIIKTEPGSFYGDYPTLGLLNKIYSLKIILEGQGQELDISELVKGDSSIQNVLWEKKAPKIASIGNYVNKHCNVVPYFQDINALINVLTNDIVKLGRIPNYDFIFWFNNDWNKKLHFKPGNLKMTMTLVDTTGKIHANITDEWKIE